MITSLKFLGMIGILVGISPTAVNASVNKNDPSLETLKPRVNIFIEPASSVDIDPEFVRKVMNLGKNSLQNQLDLINQLKKLANLPQQDQMMQEFRRTRRDFFERQDRLAQNARWHNTSLLRNQEDTPPKISQRRKIKINDSLEAF